MSNKPSDHLTDETYEQTILVVDDDPSALKIINACLAHGEIKDFAAKPRFCTPEVKISQQNQGFALLKMLRSLLRFCTPV